MFLIMQSFLKLKQSLRWFTIEHSYKADNQYFTCDVYASELKSYSAFTAVAYTVVETRISFLHHFELLFVNRRF